MIKHALLAFALIFSVTLAALAQNAPQPPLVPAPSEKFPIREIYVPFDDLNVILENDKSRVFLTRGEYEQLLARATSRPDLAAPLNAAAVAAEYRATLEEGRAVITGRLTIEVMKTGLHALPLDLGGVGIRTATLDGKPAPLVRADQLLNKGETSKPAPRRPDARPMLLVEGLGPHMLELELTVPLATSAAQQALQFRAPMAIATRLFVAAPGNVEVKAGAAVINRRYDEAAQRTEFELQPGPQSMAIVLSLNNRLQKDERVLTASSVIVDEVTQGYERIHATLSYRVLHGAVEKLRFSLPASFETTTVEAANLSRWEEKPAAAGRQIVELALREPAADRVVVRLVASRSPNAAGNWRQELQSWNFPVVEPLDVAGQSAVLCLTAEDRLRVAEVTAAGLLPIDSSSLTSAIPVSVLKAEPGAPTIRQVVSFYAPSGDYSLAARLAPAAAEVQVVTSSLLIVSEKQLLLRSGISLAPRADTLFVIHASLPAGWEITAVTDQQGRPLPIERYPRAQGRARYLLQLPTGLKPGETTVLQIAAEHVPAGWLAAGNSRQIDFPNLLIAESTSHRGTIAAAATDDFLVLPGEITGLVPIADHEKSVLGIAADPATLAYKFDTAQHSAMLTVERQSPSLTARSFAFLKLEPDHLRAHYELDFDIRIARSAQLAFSLPAATPAEVSVRGLDGVSLKDVRSELKDGRRLWTAELAERRSGRVRLAIDFSRQVSYDAPLTLPLVVAEQMEYQSGHIAVEGHPELEISVTTDARRADVGELSAAEQPLGRYVVGTYRFVANPPAVTANVTLPPSHPLPNALVERVELLTKVSASGLAQSAARYLLVTKASLLEVRLPREAKLWTARVDGQPVKPERDGDRLLISLPQAPSAGRRDLQVVYEQPVTPLDFRGSLDLQAPRLLVRAAGRDAAREVPQADLVWHLHLPSGYEVVRTNGTLDRDDARALEPAILRVGKWLYRAAGGIQTGAWPRVSASNELPYFDAKAETTATAAAEPQAAATQLEAVQLADSLAASPPPAPPVTTNGHAQGRAQQLEQSTPAKQTWALEGVSSLRIDIDPRSAIGTTFRSLGEQPRLVGQAIDRERVRAAAGGLGLLVALLAVALTRRPVRQQLAFLLCVLAVSTLPPALFDVLAAGQHVFDAVFLAGCWAGVWFVAAAVVRRAYRLLAAAVAARTALLRPAEALALLFVGLLLSGQSLAHPPEPADNTPVHVPPDAIIIPYDPEKPDERDEADKILVPYSKYLDLLNRAYPTRSLLTGQPPVDYALAGVEYEATLAGDSALSVSGRLNIEIYADAPVEVPLGFAGGMIERMTVGGEPARLSVVEPPGGPSQRLFLLHLAGKGRHQVEFRVRLSLTRQGGWRRLRARIPVGQAAALTLHVPQAGTEVRQASLADRATIETRQAGETIRWALPPSGALDIQWRTQVTSAMIDESLTAQSAAVFDVREDGLRLTWQIQLAFGRSQRDAFTLSAPHGYLIESVQGENVRGWTSAASDDSQRIEVALLKAATGTERVTVVLSRFDVIDGEGREPLRVPSVDLEGAALHQGEVQIRHSPRLGLRTVEAAGAAQVEASPLLVAVQQAADSAAAAVLQPRTYQTFRFPRMPFRLLVAVVEPSSRPTATLRAALRLAADEITLDAAFILRPAALPLYKAQISLPAGFELTRLGPPDVEWSLETQGRGQLLTVLFPDGRTTASTLTLFGTLPQATAVDAAGERTAPLPRLVLADAAEQEGELVLLPDPDTEVSITDLRGATAAPVITPPAWMKPEQQPLAKSLIRFRSPEYSGTAVLRIKAPLVSARSITNVKITPRSIEETVLVNFQIREAGIRRVELLLPEHLANARLKARLLRQRTTAAAIVAGQPLAGYVRLVLDLQDDVRGDYAVLLEHDRPLSADQQTIQPPIILTGRTDRRFIAVENGGQDELVVAADSSQGLAPLHRQEQAWRELAAVLGEQITVAYAVRDAAPAPRLAFHTLARQRTVQAAARIGLATTLFVVDRAGAYRAAVQYRVSNETEPYLEVTLPAGATLWTATVAGQPVKPLAATPSQPGVVRIPLMKTAEGEGDYLVELKYGGQMRPATFFRSVQLPLIQETNINVEQSIVRLLVPESQRWFAFSGTMRLVADEQQLAEGVQSYLYRRIQDAAQALSSTSDYTKVRASVNLKQSKEIFEQTRGQVRSGEDVQAAVKLELANAALLERAEQQVRQQLAAPASTVSDNRLKLNEYYFAQDVERSKNVVSELASNFEVAPAAPAAPAENNDALNRHWLAQNSLITDNAPADPASLSAPAMPGGSRAGSRLARRAALAGDKTAQSSAELQFFPQQGGQTAPAAGGQPLADWQKKAQDESERKQLADRESLGQAEDLRRYQRNLEDRSQTDAYGLSLDQSGAASRGRATTGEEGLAGERRSAALPGGFGGGVPANQTEFGGYLPPLSGQEANEARISDQYRQLSAGLASLDVNFPERGKLYRFTTPRGKVAIAARAVPRATISKLIVFALLLSAGALGWCLSQPAVRGAIQASASSVAGGAAVTLLGLASFISGVLPVAGLLCILTGLFLMIRARVLRAWAA